MHRSPGYDSRDPVLSGEPDGHGDFLGCLRAQEQARSLVVLVAKVALGLGQSGGVGDDPRAQGIR
ncbi:hypothetical protein [Saccharopolyspora sp. NPDC049426]|uniref:hypothetical protein n=1 Tax=Saccharopolyspora sp. NPDC049426 TaxID=3155652 RepID=UPI0034457B6F